MDVEVLLLPFLHSVEAVVSNYIGEGVDEIVVVDLVRGELFHLSSFHGGEVEKSFRLCT